MKNQDKKTANTTNKRSIIERIEAIEFDKNKNKIFGIKSAILWAYSGNGAFPLLYLSKPRHLSQEDYHEIISRVKINISR
jgi:hypothetical protein